MIKSRNDLKEYLKDDANRFGRKISLKDMFLGNDDWRYDC